MKRVVNRGGAFPEDGRDAFWDNLKCVLIFFVILGHFAAYSPYTDSRQLQALENLILLFHMVTHHMNVR